MHSPSVTQTHTLIDWRLLSSIQETFFDSDQETFFDLYLIEENLLRTYLRISKD